MPASGGFASLREAAARTRSALAGHVSAVFGRTELDGSAWDNLEEALITADVGANMTDLLLERLRGRQRRGDVRTLEDLRRALAGELLSLLDGAREPEAFLPEGLTLVLVVGFNGVGKTTTVAKLGRHWQRAGRDVLLVAGDTFRAAGSDQLSVWADRLLLPCIVGQRGGDAAALAFDAVSSSRARGYDLILMDTAGRIHTKTNLMEELRKLRRVAERQDVHIRTLLVLDATTGQNGISQARAFREAVGLDGIVVTKLDGSAKGGALFAIASEFGAAVRFVGTGEGADDLAGFDPEVFVETILSPELNNV
ncbi:MAG: signal recognition particle-docking protein FtsY [Chloroflexi bacterium]|nr:signal recognition particle-docking protein FtsY [Chloroflexota bacterium]